MLAYFLGISWTLMAAPEGAFAADECVRNGQRFCSPNSAGVYYWWACQETKPGSHVFTKTITGEKCPPVRSSPRAAPQPGPSIQYNAPPKRRPVVVPSPQLSPAEKSAVSARCRTEMRTWMRRISSYAGSRAGARSLLNGWTAFQAGCEPASHYQAGCLGTEETTVCSLIRR